MSEKKFTYKVYYGGEEFPMELTEEDMVPDPELIRVFSDENIGALSEPDDGDDERSVVDTLWVFPDLEDFTIDDADDAEMKAIIYTTHLWDMFKMYDDWKEVWFDMSQNAYVNSLPRVKDYYRKAGESARKRAREEL